MSHTVAGNPTYAVVTSRSYHVGLVQVAKVDGSVSPITEPIDLDAWFALRTRNSHDMIEGDH